MTLGHVVLGRDLEALEVTREHERVHVRQFERWGPFMGVAYVACSAVLWCQGRDFYRDNPFEREAYAQELSPCPAPKPPAADGASDQAG
jgi:hypothetical protein